MSRKNVAVIFGGTSSEHEISCISVVTVAKAIDADKYNIILIGITEEGHWLYTDSIESIEDGSWRKSTVRALISPDTEREIIFINEAADTSDASDETPAFIKMFSDAGENMNIRKLGAAVCTMTVDCAFPVLHGLFGEDGTIQGLFEMAKIPYVGCGVLSSAVSMDKLYTKIIVDNLGITQAQYVPVLKNELSDMESVINRVEAKHSYPVFVKPSNAGSSKGVSKAENREELVKALLLAADNDSKILVEETIIGREIECAVYGHGKNVISAGVGEILAAEEAAFYDFDAKYNNAESKTVIGPEMPEGKAEEIEDCARKIFVAVDGFGLARVDFFLEKGTNRVVFNEINTLPGHTAISMYPMLMASKGHPIAEYVNELIEMAEERHEYH